MTPDLIPRPKLHDLIALAEEPSSERRRELMRGVTDLFFVTDAPPLVRTIENVLVGLYSLYGGTTAYDKVRGAYVGSTGTLHEAIGLGRDLETAWTGPTRDLNWEQLARNVGKLRHAPLACRKAL